MNKKTDEKWNNEVKAKQEDLYAHIDIAKLRSGVKAGRFYRFTAPSRCQMD